MTPKSPGKVPLCLPSHADCPACWTKGDHPFLGPTVLPGLTGSSQEVGPSVGADITKCNPECGSLAPHHNQL